MSLSLLHLLLCFVYMCSVYCVGSNVFSFHLLYLMVRNVFIASLKIVVVVRITGLKSYPSGVEGVPLVSHFLNSCKWGLGEM